MKVIGIAGGIASGKSLVSKHLAEFGAHLLEADGIGHEVLREPEVLQLVRDRWGDHVFDATGQVDRAALARIVFGPPPDGPRELARLEQLTHPRIRRRLAQVIERLRAEQPSAVAVLDAPVMFKAGWDQLCDHIIFVDTPWAERVKRAALRGWSESDLRSREDAQTPLDAKRSRARFTIDNSGSIDHTREQVDQIWRAITG